MKTRHLVVAMLVIVAAAAGCKKDDKAADPAPAGGSAAVAGSAAAPAADPAAAAPAPAPATGGVPAPSDAEIEDMIEQMVVMMSDLGAAAKDKDCATGSAAVSAAIDKHKPFLDKFAKYKDDDAVSKRAEQIVEDKGYEKQLDEGLEPFEELGEKCEDDPAFKAVAEKLARSMG